MEEEQTKTIHIGLTEAKKLGKPLFDYLTEDVKELSDVQQTYIIGYQRRLKVIIDKVLPFLEEYKRFIKKIERKNAEMLEIIRGH
jgi:hypothetical protein